MPIDPRVLPLLEEILESGSSPEEVCGACPELLPQVQDRLRRLRAVQAELGVLFPDAQASQSTQDQDLDITPNPAPATALPQIPGYEVQSLLGRGGMGIVFKAFHVRLHRPVALKMLLAGACATPPERERFLREAEAEANLRHPHIVQVHDVGEHDGRPYFTMELVEGGTLAEKLAGTPQPTDKAAALLATLAEAVHVAHEGRIVHRDLKPGNILLAADGTAKISDFGLARRLEGAAGAAGLTQSGFPMGTPSYMAPEQAQGKPSAVGPAADTYALGAILYELLTGRPPFRGETAAETVQQVITQDPVAPSRLNPKVPRDLETICLKCLHKEPERRYVSAAALAADLRCFEEGRPIQARPLNWAGRSWRWCRRKPAAAALVATVLALIGLAIAAASREWVVATQRREEQARQEGRAWQAVETRLEQAATFAKQDRWPEARAALVTSSDILDASAPADLRERLRQARADAEMVAALEEIRLRLSGAGTTPETDPHSPNDLYGEAFRNYGIDVTMLAPAKAAVLVRSSAICETLLAFLHDWLYWASDANRDHLRAVVEQADDDPWRREFRKALAANNYAILQELAVAPEAAAQPPVVLSGLGGTLLADRYREVALPLLNEAQQRHPEDFWINYLLGRFWHQQRPHVAVGHYRAAVAVRPTSDQAHAMLGKALRDTGDAEGAIAAFRKALALNPNCGVGKELANALVPRGGLAEAQAAWGKILEGSPSAHELWHGYAELCLFLGDEETYRRTRKALLDRFGGTADDWIIAERASQSCLLLPDSGDDLTRAVELADRAWTAGEKSGEPRNPYLLFVNGLAEFRQGRYEQAIPLLQEAADKLPNRPGPRLVLAMAQFQSGSIREARKTLALGVGSYNWSKSPAVYQADASKVWTSHVLRREAVAMILPSLPAFLDGEYQPQDNDERLALLGVCQFEGLCATAARLYADAFAVDPNLADDLNKECLRRMQGREGPPDGTEAFNSACRYLATRCAALAGCGLGSDGAHLDATERTRWRKQAREWLQADLAAWAKMLDSESQADRDLAKKMLMSWQQNPDLAGLRDPVELDKLPSAESKGFVALWSEVDAVLSRSRR